MNRPGLLPSVLLASLSLIVLSGCRTPGAEDEGPTIIDQDRTLTPEERTFGDLIVKTGATLTVTGESLEVTGSLTVEPGGAIQNDPTVVENHPGSLLVVVGEDVLMQGEIRSADHLVLVSAAELAPLPGELGVPPEISRMQPVDVAGAPPAAVVTSHWIVQGELLAGVDSFAAGNSTPDALFVWVVGDLTVESTAAGFATIRAPNGQEGSGDSGCSAQGHQGGVGGSVYLTASVGTLRLRDVDFVGGNGGRGGNAAGYQCEDGSVVRAGEGGHPGGFSVVAQRFAGQESTPGIVLEGTVRFDGWNGGNGGNAVVTGSNGAFVRAIGGDGDVSSRTGIELGGLQIGSASLVFDIMRGGNGGNATAEGGFGIIGVCDAETGIATASTKGGNAIAEAGNGGVEFLEFVNAPSGVFASSFAAGNGGNGTAVGGTGAPGVDCALQGGHGGEGGAAFATAGDPGISILGQDGVAGSVSEGGGNGGRGGNATMDGGIGGDGGAAGCPAGEAGAGGAGTTPGTQGVGC